VQPHADQAHRPRARRDAHATRSHRRELPHRAVNQGQGERCQAGNRKDPGGFQGRAESVGPAEQAILGGRRGGRGLAAARLAELLGVGSEGLPGHGEGGGG